MPSGEDSEDLSRTYAIRLSRYAADQIESEQQRLQEIAGSIIADAWEEGLMSAMRSLATLPNRCATAVEDSLFADGVLRQLAFRRSSNSAMYRILYSIHESDADDSATVWIHAVRHSAQLPMTRLEIRDTLDF